MKNNVVYQINIGYFKQIGSTQCIEERMYHHSIMLLNNRHYNKFLQRVYNIYKNFDFEILYEFDTRQEAYQKEQELLDLYYRKPYYTMTSPKATGGSIKGQNAGWRHTQEAKDKIGKAHTGRVFSENTKLLMSKKQKGLVICKDEEGITYRITKEEYDKREDLIGITANVINEKRRTKIKCLEDSKEFSGYVEAAEYYKVPKGQICENLKGKRKAVGIKKYEGGLHFIKITE